MKFLKTRHLIRALAGVLGMIMAGFTVACKDIPTGPCVVVAHTGSIQVDSNPSGATIWLDGASTGRVTPALLEGLAPGDHKLTLKKGCNQDEERIVAVPEDETVDVFAEMQPGIPALLEPAPNAVLDNGRTDGKDKIIWDFKWKAVKGATYYNLYVMGPTAIYPLIDIYVYGSTYHFQGTGYIATYKNWQWKVRAYNGSGWCNWSEPRFFDVEPVNTDPPSN